MATAVMCEISHGNGCYHPGNKPSLQGKEGNQQLDKFNAGSPTSLGLDT